MLSRQCRLWGHTALGSTAALPSQWLGVAKSSWGHTPSFSLTPYCDPTSFASVPSAFIASQGQLVPSLDAALILPDPISLGLGKSRPRVPGASFLPVSLCF